MVSRRIQDTMPDTSPRRPAFLDADAVMDAMGPLLGLAIQPEWRGEIANHLAVIARSAGLVLDWPLEDELEPAPVFRP